MWYGTAAGANLSSTTHGIYWTYDVAGRLMQVKESQGPQSSTSPTAVEYKFTYDSLDRLKSVDDTANTGAYWAVNTGATGTPPSVTESLGYYYNASGDVSAMVIGKNSFTGTSFLADSRNDYQYDNLGRMTRVVQSGTAATGQPALARKRVDLSYNAAGDWNSIIRSTGASGSETEAATATYSYFANGGLKQIGYSHSGQPLSSATVGSALSSYSWNYDAAGRVTSFSGSSKTPAGAAISIGLVIDSD